MTNEIVSGLFVVLGVTFTIWFLWNNGKKEKERRIATIEKKVASYNGKIVRIEEVDRYGCPYSEAYINPDVVYKFYRIRYEQDKQRKLGYAILEVKNSVQRDWTWKF